MSKKTVVLGASPNPARYAYAAIERLVAAGHETVAVGRRNGQIAGLDIRTDYPVIKDVDTLTLYIGPDHQPGLYDYIFSLNPKRIIFNPGTENAELARKARENHIETVFGCTLVMLTIGTY